MVTGTLEVTDVCCENGVQSLSTADRHRGENRRSRLAAEIRCRFPAGACRSAMKIVGIGLNKTGTTTLGVCLRHWGLRHISWDREAFDLWLQARHEELIAKVAEYDSFEDWPWPLIFREIDERYPGSRFILTRRKNAKTWYRSICSHSRWTGPHDVNRYVYGYALPYGFKAQHLEFYEHYLTTVRDYFKDRPGDLLEVCWEEGDGWHTLSEFLGFEVPDIPFPHANKSPTGFTKLMKLKKRSQRRLIRLVKRLPYLSRESQPHHNE